MDAEYAGGFEEEKMEFKPTLETYIGKNEPTNPLFYLDEWECDSPQRLLFGGAPGLGKTTAAYLIAEHLGLEIVEYNASDERGIDFIRNKLKQIANAVNLWDGGRLILLDEADGLTKPAQDSLKRIMETSNCWWVLTCNDRTKIIPAIKSRCVQFRFEPFTVKHIRAYQQVLLSEFGLLSNDSAEALHLEFASDLRAIGQHIASGKTLQETQSKLDSASLSIAAGEWESAHRSMLQLLNEGTSLHYMMKRIHQDVKSVGLSAERLYTFYVVWGDFALKLNQWEMSSESFVDYFIATLYNIENKNKEE